MNSQGNSEPHDSDIRSFRKGIPERPEIGRLSRSQEELSYHASAEQSILSTIQNSQSAGEERLG